MFVRKIRLFRNKYQIPLPEIAAACGISPQRVSEIELNPGSVLRPETQAKLNAGFDRVVEQRRIGWKELYQDYQWHRDTLLEGVEEARYEL